MASALTVSRATVTAAYDLLREDGFARSRRGAGTWTELPAGHRPANVASFPADDGVIDLAIAAPGAPRRSSPRPSRRRASCWPGGPRHPAITPTESRS
ncbi:hypothetical protein O1M63_39860 [Streptomyces mirabilis]|nr:hypothetical protein [Streptomyces mirabilis]